jgi:ABC-type branched-subunit amino acid transport system substrate-binding protein
VARPSRVARAALAALAAVTALLGAAPGTVAPPVPAGPAAAVPEAPAAAAEAPATADGLSAAAARGKQIYSTGTGPAGGALTAVLGEGGAEVPASALPCAGCHGSDGRGGKEGGVRPSDLTREALRQPAAGGGDGRRRPAYSDPSLIRAVTMGIDPAGNALQVAMPRYRLTRQDAADLLAYLERLGHEAEPGLTAGEIRLGVLLPGGARPESAAQAVAVRAVLEARFAELESAGGLYGRRLTLSFAAFPEPPAERAAKLRDLLAREPLFALVGAYLAGAESEMAAAVATAGIPLIGPLTARPRQDFPLNRYVFYLTPGLAEQANALVEFAARRLPPGRRPLVVIRPDTAELAGIAGTVATAARGRGFTTLETAASGTATAQAAELAGRVGEGGAAALLLLDNGRAVQELLRQLQALGCRPLILLPGALPGEDPFAVAPAALADRLFLSLPVLPPDRTPGAATDYRRLAAAHSLPAHHVAAQMTALAAAEVLIEGLKRTGRDLSREKLIATLEKLYRFDAGLGAPVSFGPNRRIGERGAYVAGLDFAHHALGPQAPWIEIEP